MRTLSVAVIHVEDDEDAPMTLHNLRAAGYPCSSVVAEDPGDPAELRRLVRVIDAGAVVVLPRGIGVRARDIEYAVAMLASGGTDLYVGTFHHVIDEEGSIVRSGPMRGLRARLLNVVTNGALVRTPCGVYAGEYQAMSVTLTELRLERDDLAYEMAWIARRLGLRIDEFPLAVRTRRDSRYAVSVSSLMKSWLRLRRSVRRGLYRSVRRCLICFSMDVRTRDQVDGHVIRECARCKCRYLSMVPTAEAIERTRLLRLDRAREMEEIAPPARRARERTVRRRAKRILKLVPEGSRVLEIGARSGELGVLLRDRVRYSGIELDRASTEAARAAGLDVVRASLVEFVNLQAAYDAVVMYDVVEHLPNPHDAVARIRELVRPGGFLVLTTPDTESLTALVCGQRWSAHKVPEHIVLYSRTALVELLENSGFEIITAHGDYRDFDHQRLRQALRRWPAVVRRVVSLGLHVLPDPFPASSGCIRIVARRVSAPPVAVHPLPSVQMSRAR